MEGNIRGVLLLDTRAGQVERPYAIVNPDKLAAIERHLRTARGQGSALC